MLLEKITGFSSSQYLEITYFSSFSLTILNCVASFPYVKNLRHIYATFCWYSTSILDHWSFCQLCFISKFELLHQNGKEKIKSFWHVVMKKFITFLDQLLVFSGFFFYPVVWATWWVPLTQNCPYLGWRSDQSQVSRMSPRDFTSWNRCYSVIPVAIGSVVQDCLWVLKNSTCCSTILSNLKVVISAWLGLVCQLPALWIGL